MKLNLLVASLCSLMICHAQNEVKLISPEILADHSVIFRMKAPQAHSVSVTGTWNTDNKPNLFKKIDSTTFELKLGPLPSNLYEYRFNVDGLPMLDPSNNFVTTGGSVVENRILIPGGLGDLMAVKEIPHGTITAVWYPSPTIGKTRRMQVYTPAGYSSSNKKYPVLYLLHGAGGDEESWLSRGRANYILDNLIASGKAQPMVVVITNGNPDVISSTLNRPLEEMNADPSGVKGLASSVFEKSLINDVIPYIEKNFKVYNNPENRGIAGFSMGGFQTQNITNQYPEKFKYISIMSMGLLSTFNNMNSSYNKETHIAQLKNLMQQKPKFYWIGIGKKDFLFKSVIELRKIYDEIGFPYEYRESEGLHNWNEWRLYLTEILPSYFK